MQVQRNDENARGMIWKLNDEDSRGSSRIASFCKLSRTSAVFYLAPITLLCLNMRQLHPGAISNHDHDPATVPIHSRLESPPHQADVRGEDSPIVTWHDL